MVQYYGSICLSDLLDAAKKGNPAFSRSNKNGKIYVKARIFVGEKDDQYGNSVSILTNLRKEDKDKSFYFGNFKLSKDTGESQVTEEDVDINEDDFPL
jgi:hypothetical protein